MTEPQRLQARAVLASIIECPANTAHRALAQLEPDDFEHWADQTIFEALARVDWPANSARESVIVQLDRHLQEDGRYDTSNSSLRQDVFRLMETPSAHEQLPALIAELKESAYRRHLADNTQTIADLADHLPLEELDQRIAEFIAETRKKRGRLTTTNPADTLQEVAA